MTFTEQLAMLTAPLARACSSPQELDRFLREIGVLSARSAPLEVPGEILNLNTDDPVALFVALDELSGVQTGNLAAPFDSPDFWRVLGERLPPYLFVTWIEEQYPEIYDAMRLVDVAGVGADGVPYFDFAHLLDVAGDLSGQFGAVLLKDLTLVLEPLRRFFDSRGATPRQGPSEQFDGRAAVAIDPSPGVYEGVVVEPGFTAAVQPSANGLALSLSGLDGVTGPIDLGDGWTLQVTGNAGLAGLILGGDWTDVLPESTLDSAGITIEASPAAPWTLLGAAGATRLELAGLSLGVSGENLLTAPGIAFTFELDGLRLVISAGDADSFLATILGSAEIGAGMQLAGQWSPAEGLIVEGAAELTVHIAMSVALGPITINGLTFTLMVAPDQLTLEISAEISGAVGPVSAAVTGIGLRVILTPSSAPATANRVLLGPVGAQLAFKPPTGAGLGIDAGVASGGGYLSFGESTGSYDGVIDLQVLSVGISAIVIIDTRPPDVDGWSMFFALFLDLPSIQLGFGFTLTGVGGLAGINRTINTDALESAVRSGALDTVLFPDNPIEDAPFIIDQLRSIFPPADGQYVFGPVVRIGWGTPTLVEATVGVVVTLPDPVIIAVLGSVTAILPTPDLDLVALRLDADGVIDFTAGTLAVDASLHDSHVACFALSGDMALRANFGDGPSFLLALGGFHPGFPAPVGFPDLQRLRLALNAAPVLDISFECYFALTSNTVQFGADFEMSAEIAGFGIAGGAQFDALVFFSPFKMVTSLGYYVTVTAAGVDLLGVWLDATVSGPNPWRVIGDARFKILGLAESIHIDEQISTTRPEPALATEDPRDEIIAALQNPDSWSFTGGGSAGALMAASDSAAQPDGLVVVSQKVAPLSIRLDKIGDLPIGVYHTFEVQAAAGGLVSTGDAHDWFAPGYYFDLAASEQLSTPSFEWMDAGAEFGGGEPLAGVARPTTLDFEEILRDPELDEDSVAMGNVDLAAIRPEALETLGARAVSGFRIASDPDPVTLNGTSFAVTDRVTADVRARTKTWSGAHQSTPGRRSTTTVVPTWELPS